MSLPIERRTLGLLAVAALLVLAGCEHTGGQTGDQLAEDTGQNVSDAKLGESYMFEVKLTEKNHYGLVQRQPPFQFDWSLERANLIRRYKHLNDKSQTHHVYLMSNDGKVISYFMAQGKVSSVNSKLTNDRQVVRIPGCDSHQEGNDCWKVVESPQMDGSYGTNGAAIFFFTTDGKYVEWNGKYVVSEEPLNIQTQVSLVEEVGDENSSDGDGGNQTSGNETNATAPASIPTGVAG